MNNFIIKEINSENVLKELDNIGFDSAYKNIAVNKYQYSVFKIYNLTLAQANILKQTALSIGTDCAVHKEIVTAQRQHTDVIIGGSYYQFKKIVEKLKNQPFKLSALAEEINLSCIKKTQQTKLVGILNVTPDSFSDGGLYYETKSAIKKLYELIEEGADIIDIGAESTRPNFEETDAKTQIERLEPVLKELCNIKIPISIDTRNSEVADFAFNNGATIINDVSGAEYDIKILDIVQKYNGTIILQHNKRNNTYNNIVEDVYFDLKNKAENAVQKGLKNIILDVGIGFNKTPEECLTLIHNFNEFQTLNLPLMYGISRKSFLGIKNNDNFTKDALTAALSCSLIKNGIDYLRVHNVKLHKQLLRLAN